MVGVSAGVSAGAGVCCLDMSSATCPLPSAMLSSWRYVYRVVKRRMISVINLKILISHALSYCCTHDLSMYCIENAVILSYNSLKNGMVNLLNSNFV